MIAAPDWTVVGTAGLPGDSVYGYNGVPRDIACNSSGTPYIAFRMMARPMSVRPS